MLKTRKKIVGKNTKIVEILLPSQSQSRLIINEVQRIPPTHKKECWCHIRTKGSHYIYEKNGQTIPVPFHGAKEMGEGLRKKIIREMGLR